MNLLGRLRNEPQAGRWKLGECRNDPQGVGAALHAFHHAPLSNAEVAAGYRKHTVGRTALQLEQSSADQFAFPKAIAAGVETVVLPVHLEFEDALVSTQGVAASAASVPEAVAAKDFLRVFARQDASVKSVESARHLRR
jgi:hypothetical protein